MNRLANVVTDVRSAWMIVAGVAVLTVVCLVFAGQLKEEDDLLAFLPQDNAEIATFQAINKEFGGLDAALVGIETSDVFEPDFLTRLAEVTQKLEELPNLDHVMSISNLQDFAPDPMGGIRTDLLVSQIPRSSTEQAALRAHVMSRDHVRGSLVSEDGSSVVIVAFAAFRADPQKVSASIRQIVEPAFEEERLFWGGSPFISTYIFQTTQADLARLSPWAVVAIILIMLASFRDLVGTALGLVSTGLGILFSRALMAALGVPLNIVLGSMPIILFAVGSAYAIHMLSRYKAHARDLECAEAVHQTVVSTGPVVFTAGLTTTVGLLSFVCMDIEPLRVFGIFTAVGIFATLILSLTFVPAVIRIVGLPGGNSGGAVLATGTIAGLLKLLRFKKLLWFGIIVVAVDGTLLSMHVDSRVDQAAFYSPGSPPDQSDRFLTEKFGGAHFIQVLVEGDLREPVHLRRIRDIGEQIQAMDHVARVQHVGLPVALLNEMMEGAARVPDTRAKVETVFGFLTGNPAVRQLANEDRAKALMHVQIGTTVADEVDDLLQQIERLVGAEGGFVIQEVNSPDVEAERLSQVVERVERLMKLAGLTPDVTALKGAVEAPAAQLEIDSIRFALHDHMMGAESLVEISPSDAAEVARSVVALGPDPGVVALDETVATALGKSVDDAMVADLSWSLGTPLEEAWAAAEAEVQVSGLEQVVGPIPDALRSNLGLALLDLAAPTVAVTDEGAASPLKWTVSGLPVMHRGLSRSVTANQLGSLGFALGLVALILSLAFRSVRAGLLATTPTALALVIIYGGMAVMDIHLDIGTSMLASIIIGAGVDYAVHLLSAWYAREDEDLLWGAARAIVRVGPAVWTNALMVAVGFFVLTLGEARPLKNVGGLTAAAMIVAALVTFVVIPAIAGQRSYRRTPETKDPADDQLVGIKALNTVD